MMDAIASFFYQSELLVISKFEAYCKDGKVIEQDERGIKVLMLSSGEYLKVFKLRGWMTSSLFFSNARSFIRNSKRLNSLNIPTIQPVKLYHFSHSSDTAVLYKPLAGNTVRSLLANDKLSAEKLKELAMFIAMIHQKGVHFKSLHFGNIVYTVKGNYGLIDIADMRIFLWPLSVNTRIRSLKRIKRYQEDIQMLGVLQWASLVAYYLEGTSLSRRQKDTISKALIDC